MKRYITWITLTAAIVAVFCVAPVYAGQLDVVQMTLSNVSTSVTPDTVNSGKMISGKILDVYIDFTGATSPDADIDIVGVTNYFDTAITVLSVDDATVDVSYHPRNSASTTAGAAITDSQCPISVLRQYIQLQCGDCNKTNVNVTVTIIYEHED